MLVPEAVPAAWTVPVPIAALIATTSAAMPDRKQIGGFELLLFIVFLLCET
jgi:hypothetical protein